MPDARFVVWLLFVFVGLGYFVVLWLILPHG
jgi:hypothetical protein